MQPRPCPQCGEPKHPLKRCSNCGASSWRQASQPTKEKGAGDNTENPSMLTKKQRERLERNRNSILTGVQGIATTPLKEGRVPHAVIEYWKKFLKEHDLNPEKATFRPASRLTKAAPWLLGSTTPKMPMEMLSNVQVFDCWTCRPTEKFAKEFNATNPDATWRAIQVAILNHLIESSHEYPYIWWLWLGRGKTRAIYKDAADVTFVKLDNKWQLAYSLRDTGGLVGAQGAPNCNYEAVPRNGYFVCSENEGVVRTGYQCSVNPLNERKYQDFD